MTISPEGMLARELNKTPTIMWSDHLVRTLLARLGLSLSHRNPQGVVANEHLARHARLGLEQDEFGHPAPRYSGANE